MDVVLDGIGGSFTGPGLSVLNPDGTLISIGYAAGTGVHGFRFALFSAESGFSRPSAGWTRR